MVLIAGIDEAGKGPVLGPLIVSCVMFDSNLLQDIPVADSKILSKKKREKLYEQIDQKALQIVIIELTAQELNHKHETGLKINEIEIDAFAQAVNELSLRPDIVYLDAADVNAERFGTRIAAKISKEIKIVSEHKADAKFPVVSAASIVAKVQRDLAMTALSPFSGYPSDQKMIDWLTEYYRENKSFPNYTRTFWKTCQKIILSVSLDSPCDPYPYV